MKKNIIFFGLSLLVIAGCAVHKKQQPLKNLQHYEILAKCTDLPDAPFQLSLLDVIASENNDQLQLFYTFTGSPTDLTIFYEQQMERLGWDMITQSNLQDYVLLFSKPYKNCLVLLHKNRLAIYVSQNKNV